MALGPCTSFRSRVFRAVVLKTDHGRAAVALFAAWRTGALSRRKRFSPRNNRIGAAMKIEDEVPTTMPNSITQAKPEIDSLPNSASGRLARNTVIEVPSV